VSAKRIAADKLADPRRQRCGCPTVAADLLGKRLVGFWIILGASAVHKLLMKLRFFDVA
jgi:hypothetical protein